MKREYSATEYAALILSAFAVAGLLGLWGCGGGAVSRLNAPPQGTSENPSALQDGYVNMTDNALLEDMSVSSAHFVPHTAELNALGVRRLNRYAEILKIYGGTLRYDELDGSDEMVKQRMDRIKGMLTSNGVEADKIKVVQAMAGGPGMRAGEAIVARESSSAKASDSEKQETTAIGEAASKVN
ncbi:MAG: hypothetical protein KA354_01170 [Phycisphaerae bacterium]|nr:hypothetical protein [Phycisphaerae bacterium]